MNILPRIILHDIKLIYFEKLWVPIWDWGTIVLCRSHKGENSRPRSLSMSPCLKNSSIHLDVHWWWRSQVLAGWDTSHVCNNKLNTRVLSITLPSYHQSWRLGPFQIYQVSQKKCLIFMRDHLTFIFSNFQKALSYEKLM